MVTGIIAVLTKPGYSGRNGMGSLVAVLTPFIGPVQLSGTVTFAGTGVLKANVKFTTPWRYSAVTV